MSSVALISSSSSSALPCVRRRVSAWSAVKRSKHLFQQESVVAHDDVQRGAQLVRHRRHEVRLEPVGALQLTDDAEVIERDRGHLADAAGDPLLFGAQASGCALYQAASAHRQVPRRAARPCARPAPPGLQEPPRWPVRAPLRCRQRWIRGCPRRRAATISRANVVCGYRSLLAPSARYSAVCRRGRAAPVALLRVSEEVELTSQWRLSVVTSHSRWTNCGVLRSPISSPPKRRAHQYRSLFALRRIELRLSRPWPLLRDPLS